MSDNVTKQISDMLLPSKSLASERRKRLNEHAYETIRPSLQGDYEADGWVVDRVLKRSIRMRRLKPHDVAFEDRVWAMFASLNFPLLNTDRRFVLSYGGGSNERKQLDVFAADSEVIVVVECKSAASPTRHAFKSEVEAIQGTREGLMRTIRSEYPDHKVKFVLATNNYAVSDETLERIEAARISYLDEDAVDYYLDLAKHLGKAARFQLLGWLFADTNIPGLDTAVNAIQGKMGGYTYYTFMVEPARLLKLAYVLHRDKANRSLMPTYQRLIRKNRLQSVTAFVEDGGFFPYSIVLNIVSGKHGLKFDKKYGSGDEPRLGVLHLPQTFRSAYVIDGQHRLYGYADSPLADTELIPVVAFVDLPGEKQVEIFMEINENQKAVPKNLQNTLNADLLWKSASLMERARALRLKLAQDLEADKTSPLHGRILLGEDRTTDRRCITIEALGRGFQHGRFIGTFTKTEIREAGSFYRGDNDATYRQLSKFADSCLAQLRDGLPTQYSLGKAEGGFVFMNSGIEAYLRVLGDVVDHLILIGATDPRKSPAADVYAEVEPYIDILISYLSGLSREGGQELRRQYGTGGTAGYWRTLQKVLADAVPGFDPVGLASYLDRQAKQENIEAFEIIRDVETFLNQDIRERLEDHYGSDWFKKGVPLKVYTDASTLAVQKNRDLPADEEVEPWDCLHIRDYQQVLQKDKPTWDALFAQTYTRPEDEKKPGGWKAKTDWVDRLNKIRNDTDHQYSVKEEDYDFLVSLKAWLAL